jgi:hypothetical protein
MVALFQVSKAEILKKAKEASYANYVAQTETFRQGLETRLSSFPTSLSLRSAAIHLYQ